MLLFEFFPLVLAIVSVIVAFFLIRADRAAREDPAERAPRKVLPPRVPGDPRDERGSARPSARG